MLIKTDEEGSKDVENHDDSGDDGAGSGREDDDDDDDDDNNNAMMTMMMMYFILELSTQRDNWRTVRREAERDTRFPPADDRTVPLSGWFPYQMFCFHCWKSQEL